MSLRYRVCPDCGEMHDVHDWPDNHRFWNEVLCTPSVISDVQPPTMSMGNGKIYDSKSEMRKHYKQDGWVEVGNDPARLRPFKRPPTDRRAIKDAIEKAAARVDRGDVTELTKHKLLTRVGKKPPKIDYMPTGPSRRGVKTVRPTFN
jgi:hypothetical protein